MRISKKAWHHWLFRVGSSGTFYEQVSLCQYFWRAVYGAIVVLVFPLLIAFIVGCLGFIGLSVGRFAVLLYHKWPVMFIEVILSAVWGYALCHLVRRRIQKRRGGKRSPSLLGAYFKARKERLCPIIEFVE